MTALLLPTWAGWVGLTTWGLGFGIAGWMLGRRTSHPQRLLRRAADDVIGSAERARRYRLAWLSARRRAALHRGQARDLAAALVELKRHP